MPDRVIIVRESEWREMREVLAKCAEGWGNAVEFDLLPPSHHSAATYLRDEVRAALAKSEAAVGQPVAHAYVVAGECEQIEWGTDAVLPDDPALVWLYPHPTPDGCGRAGKPRLMRQVRRAALAKAEAVP